jgi:hypothetical protein
MSSKKNEQGSFPTSKIKEGSHDLHRHTPSDSETGVAPHVNVPANKRGVHTTGNHPQEILHGSAGRIGEETIHDIGASTPASHILNKRSEGKSQASAAGSASEGDSTDNGMTNLMPEGGNNRG